MACGLFYYRRGFHLAFDSARRFSFCSFYLSPDTPPPKEEINYTQVLIKPRRGITSQTRPTELVTLLGKPSDESHDGDGSLLTFAVNALTLDFTFNAEGRLVELDVFPVKSLKSTQTDV